MAGAGASVSFPLVPRPHREGEHRRAEQVDRPVADGRVARRRAGDEGAPQGAADGAPRSAL